jgi:hypothetical protein
MTEGNMTGRPYGGANERPDGAPLPGESPDEDSVSAAPEQSPRSAQGAMSDDVTHVPGAADDPDGKKPGMPDATGPQG